MAVHAVPAGRDTLREVSFGPRSSGPAAQLFRSWDRTAFHDAFGRLPRTDRSRAVPGRTSTLGRTRLPRSGSGDRGHRRQDYPVCKLGTQALAPRLVSPPLASGRALSRMESFRESGSMTRFTRGETHQQRTLLVHTMSQVIHPFYTCIFLLAQYPRPNVYAIEKSPGMKSQI